MVQEPDQVEVESVRLPLELDQVLDCLGLEHGPLIADASELVHDIILVVHPCLLDESILVWLHLQMCCHVRQKIDGVIDLEDLAGISLGLGILRWSLKGILWEGGQVVLSDAKQAVAVGSDHCLPVSVS